MQGNMEQTQPIALAQLRGLIKTMRPQQWVPKNVIVFAALVLSGTILTSYYQALLSLGDRRIAPAIELAEANGGQWRKAVADAGLDGDFYIYRDRTNDVVLPWNIIDGGMKEPFFRAEFDKSTRAEWTLPPKRAKENARLLPVLN
jgi:hypothetical protein